MKITVIYLNGDKCFNAQISQVISLALFPLPLEYCLIPSSNLFSTVEGQKMETSFLHNLFAAHADSAFLHD